MTVLNLQNREGETVLGCVLKFAASGLLGEADTTMLVKLLLEKGAISSLRSFEEQVQFADWRRFTCSSQYISSGVPPSH